MDRGGELRAAAPPRCNDRGADRCDHRTACSRAAAGRLPELLVYRPRDRQALDQSPRQPRALLRRPHAGRRGRLFPGDRPAEAARHHASLCRSHRRDFGRGEGQKRGYCGHQEIELALIKLYAGDGRAASTSTSPPTSSTSGARRRTISIVEAVARGEDPKAFWASAPTNTISRIRPVREQDKVVGHAVRAMYMYAAMADLAADLGDNSLKRACEALWRDVTGKRMYVTAGPWAGCRERGLHDRLRPAERHGLCRDLRLGRADLLGAAHAQSRARRRLRRHHGAGALQRRAVRPCAERDAVFLPESARKRRQPHALGMAPLPMLHDERVAPGRLDRRLFLLDLAPIPSRCISTAATPPT